MTRDIARFLTDIESGRGFSPRTIEAYRRDLTSWTDFLKVRQAGTLPASRDVKPHHVSLYLADLSKRGRSARTVARHLAAIRSFARYLRRHGHAADWAAAIRGPRLPKPAPSFMTEAEMERLFSLEFGDGVEGLRDRALLELLYATGLRLAELVGLNRDEKLDLERRQARVVGKGNRERIVPFGRPAAAALEAYVNGTGQTVKPDRQGLPLFFGRAGGRISRRSVQRIVRGRLSQVAQKAGLSPHVLRHTMATHLLARMSRGQAASSSGGKDRKGSTPGRRPREQGPAAPVMDIRAVQEILGHVSLSSTQVYTHITVDRLRAAMKLAHPRGEDRDPD